MSSNYQTVKKWRKKNPKKWHLLQKKANLKRYWNLSLEEYERMSAAQGNVCAICKLPPRGTARNNKALHVDHDHSTGTIRGLLCGECNRALGLLRDDPVRLIEGANYLQRYAKIIGPPIRRAR